MLRLVRYALLICGLTLTGSAFGTTYYIAANGNDSNSGTSKTSPWLHAPGMTGCANNCSTYTPQPGDTFILRGGDTWHWSTGGTIGIPWKWKWAWSGSSGSQITVGGEDQTWYSGGSWSRPKLNGDNPLSTSTVASCVNAGTDFLDQQGSYVTFDQIEFLGYCNVSPNNSEIMTMDYNTTYSKFTNFYIHGWTYTGTYGQRARAISGATSGPSYPQTNNEFAYNIFDGSDSSPQSLTVDYGDCYNWHHNYISHVANMVCNNAHLFHDNVYEYVNESLGGVDHGNVFEFYGESNQINFVYNNVVRHIGNLSAMGVNAWVIPTAGFGDYIFNNIFYDVNVAGNNYFNTASHGSGDGPTYFYNNTFQRTSGGYLIASAQVAQNNHLIVDGGATFLKGVTTETTDLVETNAQATSANYTSSNQYAPTASKSPTVQTGTDSTSICNSFSDSEAQAACKQSTVLACSYDGAGNLSCPAQIANARPSGSAWDIGTYVYGTSSGVQPPTDLSATVQ